jgi:hypothetical protein
MPASVNGRIQGHEARPVAAYANPFEVSGPYAAAMRLALALALVPGLGTGLLLVLVAAAHLPLAIGWPQLAQAHGQIQTLGFVLTFIVAVGLQLFPRFLGSPLRHAQRAAWGSAIVALALIARLLGQPLAPSPARAALLVFAAAGMAVGVLVAGSAFHGLRRPTPASSAEPSGSWRRFVLVGGLALGAALGLGLWSGVVLAMGAPVVPVGLDEGLIHLELAGFATCLVFAVASRVFGRFLLLQTRPAFGRSVPWLAWSWAFGLLMVVVGWLLGLTWSVWLRWLGSLVELGVLVIWLWQAGLYQLPSRESGTPYVTNPTRRWVRLAFALLLFSLAFSVGLFGREALLGVPPTITELSAARHALGQGFLMPLMVAMAVRMLPVVSADALKHRLRLELIVDVLLIGALVRVGAEAVGGYSSETGPLVALGGTLSIVGFALFAVAMWSSLGRLPRTRPSAA